MADDKTMPLALREIVKDASSLAEKRKELDTLRADHSREWAQNIEFYNGNQWVFWNTAANRIETYAVDDSDKPRWKVRLTSNQVLPGVTTLVAQMTKTRPTIRAIPDSGADRDVKAAQMAERLYEHWWHEFSLAAKLKSALVHAQLSQGYWLINWDPLAGKPFKVMRDPETGAVIEDEALADLLREEVRNLAQQNGLPEEELLGIFEQTLYVGDIDVKVLDGTQVWFDPIPTNFEDAKYAICRYPMDVDEIEARWKKRVTPDSTTADRRPALMYTKGRGDQKPKNAREVFVGYFRPSPALPKGRYVVWIEGPNDILYESDWNFPFSGLPLVKFPGMERPGSALDEPRVTHVRPLNKELNNTLSKVAMFKNLALKPQMLAPIGSLRQRLTDEPGAIFEYAPIQNHVPDWRQPPQMQGWVFEYLRDVQGRIDRAFNLIPTERSQLPARTDSGHLVELVQEAVADQLSPEIHRMEIALARAGNLMVALAQKYYSELRHLRIIGPGGGVQVEKFRNSDISGGYSFHAEAGSGLPRTRAGQTQQIRELMEMGMVSPEEAIPYLPIAGLKTIQQRLQSDEEFAHRKIDKLLKGEPLNIPAMLDAIAIVQEGINPQTGEMFQSPEEAVAFVNMAGLQPAPFENLQVSAYVLGQHMKSKEFDNYPPEQQQHFIAHFQMLVETVKSQQIVTEPVKKTLSLKGTVGPTVAAEILQQGGIQSATPETMAEPPLETSVYDSMDKPDADVAGNDPLTQQDLGLQMERDEEKHMLQTAKAMRELAEADKASARADEIHRERVRQVRQPKKSGGA